MPEFLPWSLSGASRAPGAAFPFRTPEALSAALWAIFRRCPVDGRCFRQSGGFLRLLAVAGSGAGRRAGIRLLGLEFSKIRENCFFGRSKPFLAPPGRINPVMGCHPSLCGAGDGLPPSIAHPSPWQGRSAALSTGFTEFDVAGFFQFHVYPPEVRRHQMLLNSATRLQKGPKGI